MKRWKQLYIDSSLGFTLVELMITIGVVAILTSMAVPTVQIYTEKARKVECQVSIVHYLRAQEIYYAENNSFRTGANWRVNRNGVSRLNIGWNINRRPDQAGLYHFPELGVDGSYRQEIYFEFKTEEDFDHDGSEDRYSYRKYLRPNTNGQWRVRNQFWFDISGCPAQTNCR
jgi:prepilin-type N-terminal cleavage/methylation domain-containing protein